MNKKYIDFVPVKSDGSGKGSTKKGATKKGGARSAKVDDVEMSEIFDVRTTKPRAGVTVSTKKGGKSAATVVPKARFVNTEKVAKRPLSKNAYPKKEIPTPKEEKLSAPVKIIDKPAKDSKAGLIVAIILTIILGAAAGTVAFLLLPK